MTLHAPPPQPPIGADAAMLPRIISSAHARAARDPDFHRLRRDAVAPILVSMLAAFAVEEVERRFGVVTANAVSTLLLLDHDAREKSIYKVAVRCAPWPEPPQPPNSPQTARRRARLTARYIGKRASPKKKPKRRAYAPTGRARGRPKEGRCRSSQRR